MENIIEERWRIWAEITKHINMDKIDISKDEIHKIIFEK